MQECGDSDVLTYGAIQIIPATHTVLLNGKPVHLAKMEYRLLGYLLQHPGETLPRQDLLSAVWGAPPSLKTRTLDIHICALRRKLSLGKNLETVMKVGYKLHSHEKGRSE
ncbi:winged helix-turn-helix domain-containing protein [uncultured Subdoligranulum sp.]|uniref:winged helix-turn-helix domain-containing protein n=1 Tax=uncultured Subdoligranulum sp. TaxID=512298 RepID=UPI0025E9E76C|nr:winged helix-turn-helix domain-containing protein [uncultured Subdoligranulum sp.]